MNEIWRAVAGFEGFCEVSNLGRVRSLRRMVRNKHGLRVAPGGILSGSFNEKGYRRVDLSDGQRVVRARVSRLVAAAFIGPIPEGYEVCHNDNCRSNDVASNLRIDTHAGNMRDAVRFKTKAGELSPRAKLKASQVAEIRAATVSGLKLARMFGISHSQVYAIRNNRSWKL